jgi:hypothetical protein
MISRILTMIPGFGRSEVVIIYPDPIYDPIYESDGIIIPTIGENNSHGPTTDL